MVDVGFRVRPGNELRAVGHEDRQVQHLVFELVTQRHGEDDLVAGTKVQAVIVSMPGMGKIHTKRLMEEIGIAENRTLRGLGSNQRAELIERFS